MKKINIKNAAELQQELGQPVFEPFVAGEAPPSRNSLTDVLLQQRQ
jgi:hypothetical protein